jgi:thiol-disulfide isomerase/thioredoxin
MSEQPAASPPPANPSAKPSPVLIIFLIFPLVGILAALGLALSVNQAGSSAVPTPLAVTLEDTSVMNKPAPNFELTGLDGKSYRLSSFRGRVVFLNFWATWCIPCQTELPAFVEFSKQQGENGAIILAVNQAEKAAQISTYLEDQGIQGLTILLDSDLEVNTAFDIRLLPTTYVIDPAGVVRYLYVGEMPLNELNAVVEKLTG